MIIAIDGAAGSGKSSTAVRISKEIKFIYLDTGAMYRAITLKCVRLGLDLNNKSKLKKLLNSTKLKFRSDSTILLDGEDVTVAIRNELISKNVSYVSSLYEVRKMLVYWQREIARDKNVVIEGRDIGTVVFPDADIKIFLSADIKIRARRRYEELRKNDYNVSEAEIKKSMINRDNIDTNRVNSPLIKHKDAIEIDTTNLSLDDQVEKILKIINLKGVGLK